MSAVVLQVGQCGNQLGLDWWKLLTKKSNQHKRRCPFSSRNGELAAVCVDTEPKVLRKANEFVKNKEIRPCNIIEGKGGRGGNWAYGYRGGRGEGENGLLQRTMEAVRREAESRDYYGGTVLLHSLSGGTGSGLGSRLCEEIREEFPVAHILTVSVVPHQSGESPLQHYNTLLSLAALHRSVDGMLLFHNDHVLSRAGFLQKSHAGFGAVSCGFPQSTLPAMNAHITSCMAGLLLPVKTLTTRSCQSLGVEPWELVRSVCPVPTAKLLYTAQASASEVSPWDTLVSETLQNLPQLSTDGKPGTAQCVGSEGTWVYHFTGSSAVVLLHDWLIRFYLRDPPLQRKERSLRVIEEFESQRCLGTVPEFSEQRYGYSSRAVLAVARGNQDNSFIVSNVLQKLRQAHRCVHWNPFPVDYWTDPRNEANVSLCSRTLTVCSNHSSVTRLLGHVAQRATEMLSARAYLHWYGRYGIETEEFQQALNTFSGLVEEYESQ